MRKTTSALGSTRSSESFGQMTGYVRLADVQSTIFETPIMNDRFARERTVLKNSAMSESRTKVPFAAVSPMSAWNNPAKNPELDDIRLIRKRPQRLARWPNG